MRDQEEYMRWWFEKFEESYHYIKEEKELITAIKDSELSIHNKMVFSRLLMDLGSERMRVQSLSERLSLSYTGSEDIESYLNKIVLFNPKLNEITIEAGLTRQDEKGEYSCCIHIPVRHNQDMDVYFVDANEQIDRIKQVLRILIVDAKKMRL